MAAWTLSSGGARAAAESEPGLVAEIAAGGTKSVVPIPTPNFSLGVGESLHPGVGPAFAVTMTGLLRVGEAGRYRFVAEGARLEIAGASALGREVELGAGEHPIRIFYERPTGRARLQVRWSGPGFAEEPIPTGLYRRAALGAEGRRGAAALRGRALAAELGCAGCHARGEAMPPPARGPDLTTVGDRTNARWIAAWLEAPHAFRAGARMPAMLDATERRDVAAYLAGRKGRGAAATPAIPPDAEKRGKELYANVGCVACHAEGGVSIAGMGSKMTVAALASYLRNPLAVNPSGRMPSLGLNDEESLLIASHLVTSRAPAFERPVAAGDPARGKALVAGRGCLGCHTVDDGGAQPSTLGAPAFAKLRANAGCLAPAPRAGLPRYRLTAADREALAAYLATPDVAPAPTVELARRAELHRCTACHELGAPAKVAFEEVPPPLTETGNKLRESWLREVLVRGKRLRPWMTLRMPNFGAEAGEAMAPLFAAAVGAMPGDGERPAAPPPTAVREGVRYLGRGEEGLACITCHDFGAQRSQGATRGPDMVSMTERLRPEWFRRWLQNPARIQPGTQMPSFFAGMPAHEGDKRIGHIWSALALGEAIPRPQGLADERRVALRVGKAPIVFRAFMPDAAARSLAVGFPGGPSYSFDLEGCRLQYAWQGDFLDVTKVWVGRGGEDARPLGRKFYVPPAGFPLRIGDATKAPTVRFRGYRLTRGIPTFTYEVDGATVRETITPKGRGLARTFTIEGHGDRPVVFQGGEAEGLRLLASAGKWERGRLVLTGEEAKRFTITIGAEERRTAEVRR